METKIKNYTELTELHLFENRSGFSKIYKIENNKGLAIVKVEFHLSTGTFKVIVDKMGINSYPHIDYKNKMMLNIISTRLFHKLDKIRSVKCPKALKSFFIDLKKIIEKEFENLNESDILKSSDLENKLMIYIKESDLLKNIDLETKLENKLIEHLKKYKEEIIFKEKKFSIIDFLKEWKNYLIQKGGN